MKKYLILIIITIGFFSCKKEYDSIYEFEDKAGKSYLKLVHAVTNALATPTSTTQAGLQVYLNDTKITGTAMTFGGVFPGLEYALVPASSTTLKAIIPAGTSNPDITVFNGNIAMTEKKIYTAFITDTLPTASLYLVEDDLSPTANTGNYFVRFVNVTPKSTAYDLYNTTDASTVASNIGYKAASSFVQLSVGTGSRTFAVRKPGNTTNIVTVSITPVGGRMYTVFSYGIDGGSGLRAPKVTFFTSRFQTSGY